MALMAHAVANPSKSIGTREELLLQMNAVYRKHLLPHAPNSISSHAHAYRSTAAHGCLLLFTLGYAAGVSAKTRVLNYMST